MVQFFLKKISKRYHSKTIFDELSYVFSANSGKVFGFVGDNGAGKSSLFKIMSGIDIKFSGDVVITGTSEKTIGFLPEVKSLSNIGTVIDTLKLWARLHDISESSISSTVENWLFLTDLLDRRSELITNLSKGNVQKLQIACAVMHSPRFVFLDEPFSGLDPINQEWLLSIISRLKSSGAMVFLSAHQLELLDRVSDECYLLFNGVLEEIATERVAHDCIYVSCSNINDLKSINISKVDNDLFLINLNSLSFEDMNLLLRLSSQNRIRISSQHNLREKFLSKSNGNRLNVIK